MKKWFLLSTVSVIALSACNSAGEDTTTDEAQENEEQTEETIIDEEEEENVSDEEDMEEDLEEPAEIVYEVNQALSTIEPIEGTDANPEVVLLTIDDTPDTYGVEMAHTLKELDVPAIFFVNGHFINTEEKAEALREIYELGFEIGNHTNGHPNLREISEEQQREEIVELNNRIEEIIGERPRFFRAPFGVNTEYSRSVVEEEGMTSMNWTYGYDFDSNYMTKESITDIMVNAPELGNGGNLLMHDREWTAAGLEGIVTGLREKGYDFVDPSQLK